MKKNIGILCIVAAVLLAAVGCDFFPAVEGSGFPRTVTYDFPGITKVAAESTFKVKVVPDAVTSVSVTSDDNLASYLVVERSGETLRLGLLPGYSYRQVMLIAEVHLPVLSAVSLSGASEARILQGFASPAPLQLTLSGASTLESGAISCASLDANVSGASGLTIQGLSSGGLSAIVSGASSLTATGTAAGLESLAVSGASKADLRGLTAAQASVNISGASRCYVNVGGGKITLTVSGASILYHTGSPIFVIGELSGGSSILRL